MGKSLFIFMTFGSTPEGYDAESPTVYGLGPYVVTHKRHYAQQCEYSIIMKRTNGRYVYSSHETTAFADNSSDQGPVTKYTLPVSDREKVLKQLQRMNVTAFSLFGSEESLMETLAYQGTRYESTDDWIWSQSGSML